VYVNTDFLEGAVPKAEVFFKHVVVPEIITGNVKNQCKMWLQCRTGTSHADDGTEGTQPDFPCGKCNLECPEEAKEFNEIMSAGCEVATCGFTGNVST